MSDVLWLSGADVAETGICTLEETVKIVEKAFRLFDARQAIIVQEAALRLHADRQDHACYSLPAYVGGDIDVCGLKWTAHGAAADPAGGEPSRIQATVVLNAPDRGVPLAVMNGTEIGAARTGAVTAAALRRLAPVNTKKAALCGAGGQAERQLQAILYALPQVQEIAVWSRGDRKNHALAGRYQPAARAEIRAVRDLEDAVDGADVIIGATSADTPYLTAEHLRSASLYCHIGFHEITEEAVNRFSRIVVDTWEEAKNVSGQSLFRLYRAGRFDEARITGTLGAILAGRLEAPRGTPEEKVMFDAFGLPIFDLSVAKEAYLRARRMGLGTRIAW